MSKSFLEEFVESSSGMRRYQQERAISEAVGLICKVMEELNISRSELATMLGKSRGWVTQLLDGETNKTIRTVADVLSVLGREFHSSECPIQIGSMPKPTADSGFGGLKVRFELEYQPTIVSQSSSKTSKPVLARAYK